MKPNRFVDDTQKPFHSHTYAQAESGGSMGSTSPQSFGQRYHIDRNRNHVAKYGDSFVARGGYIREEYGRRTSEQNISVPPRTGEPGRQAFNAGGASGVPRGSQMQIPRRGFSEPPSRPYNPFS
ncbi:MAG TPA: hypothetical protein VIQ80_00370 [Candidatus Saccharimonadales bacterium]